MTHPKAITYANMLKWLRARQHVVGASDTAGLYGVGYASQSPLSIWASKTTPIDESEAERPLKVEHNKDGSISVDDRLNIGLIQESSSLRILREVTGLAVRRDPEFTIRYSPEFPMLGATLDGLTVIKGYGAAPVECKNVGEFFRADWENGGVPQKFEIQVQHQMAVMGARIAVLVGLIGGNRAEIRFVHADQRIQSAIIARAIEFWRYVEDRTPPPADASDATEAALKALYPRDDGTAIQFTNDMDRWFRKRVEAGEFVKEAEEAKKRATNEIRRAMGSHTYAIDSAGNPVCSLKETTRNTTCKPEIRDAIEYYAANCKTAPPADIMLAMVESHASFRSIRTIKKLPKGVKIHEQPTATDDQPSDPSQQAEQQTGAA